MEEHRLLQSHLDDAISERDDALSRTRELLQQVDSRRSDKGDVIMKAEIDRLRAELYVALLLLTIYSSYFHLHRQKSEDNLAVAESELEKQTSVVAELTHRVDELQGHAAEAARLKDQVDE